jgi:Spy/CpxP family protein refolding chaperone
MPCIHDDDAFLQRIRQIVNEAVQAAGSSNSQSLQQRYEPNQLLTGEQAAELLNCSERSLQTWRKQKGKGPRPTMIGTLARYRYSDVVNFIDESGQ